jgi:Nucleotidyl transferase AbiEii toxin, Type IV TA system
VTTGYPRSFGDLGKWATENGVPVLEARVRLAQYALLCAIASAQSLREAIVFKGGNALDFVWQPNRSTVDLDFSFAPTGDDEKIDIGTIQRLLTNGLRTVEGPMGLTLALNGVRQNPPGVGHTFATLEARIGYALPDEARLRIRMQNGQTSIHVIRVEISLNDPVCAATTFAVNEDHALQICTLEDIVAEKLRALLQQPIRKGTDARICSTSRLS